MLSCRVVQSSCLHPPFCFASSCWSTVQLQRFYQVNPIMLMVTVVSPMVRSRSRSFRPNQKSVRFIIISKSLYSIQKLLRSKKEISEIYTFVHFIYIIERSDSNYGANWLLVGAMWLGAKWPWGKVPRYWFCNVMSCNDGLPGYLTDANIQWLVNLALKIVIFLFRASMIFDPFYDMLQTRKKKVTQGALN